MGIAEQLQRNSLFREVSIPDLEALITRMEQQTFPKGTVIFQKEDVGDTMYIIRRGRIRIFMQDSQQEEITLTHYGENEIFGELSPIDLRPRSASAAADEDLDVLALDRAHFLDFLDERPQIGLAMMRSLSQRLRNTTQYLEEYKPKKDEKQVVAPGRELSRRGAQGVMANILDNVMATEEDEAAFPNLEVTQALEATKKLPGAVSPTAPTVSAQDRAALREAVPEHTASMGIFDRITIKKGDDEPS